MAHLHFHRDTYKSGGSTATTRLEYITRQSAQELHDAERQLRYIGRDGREDLVMTESHNLPAWCANNPHTYFNAAERYEGKGWVAFEEYKIALPHEFTHAHNRALTEDLVATIGHGRLPITSAFHDPTTMDEARQQPHLHVILSRRQTDAHARTPEQHFRKYNAQHPDHGGAQKDPFFAERRHVWHQRVLISDVINVHLERAGMDAQVHPARLADRGMDREPEPKLLPSESRDYRERGIVSATMHKVLDIRAQRAAQWEREQRDAQHYWEARKSALGIAPTMSHAERLARINVARAQIVTQGAARETAADLARQARHLERDIHQIEVFQHRLHAERMREQALQRTGAKRSLAAEQHVAALLAHGQALGVGRDEPDAGIQVTMDRKKRGYSYGR